MQQHLLKMSLPSLRPNQTHPVKSLKANRMGLKVQKQQKKSRPSLLKAAFRLLFVQIVEPQPLLSGAVHPMETPYAMPVVFIWKQEILYGLFLSSDFMPRRAKLPMTVGVAPALPVALAQEAATAMEQVVHHLVLDAQLSINIKLTAQRWFVPIAKLLPLLYGVEMKLTTLSAMLADYTISCTMFIAL
jgi:hypothetical protein